VVAERAPVAGATALATGLPPQSGALAQIGPVRAAVCVGDDDGMLNWAELPAAVPPDAGTIALLNAALDRAGCGTTRMIVGNGVRALLGGALDVTAAPATGVTAGGVRLVRGSAPGAHAIFEDTTPLPYNAWGPIQSQRVKPPGK
jgi:hypothetical protein